METIWSPAFVRCCNCFARIVGNILSFGCLLSESAMLSEKHMLFVTNNATKSRRNYKKKFDSLGVQAEVVSKASCP